MQCVHATRPRLGRLARILLIASLSTTTLSGCGIFKGAGPSVILIPAKPADLQPYQLYESVRARVIVTLEDGTQVVSKNRVKIPAGAWVKEYGFEKKPEGSDAGD